jgi:hypothetical protein
MGKDREKRPDQERRENPAQFLEVVGHRALPGWRFVEVTP